MKSQRSAISAASGANQPTPRTNPAQTRLATPRTYSKHGLTTLKHAVKGLGGRVIDMRTTLGKALAQWRADLVADLGGREAISTQQAAVIDLAVKTKLLLDSVDAWILTAPTLIDRRKRAMIPVLRERQQLADALARYMTILGLEKKAKPPISLAQYLEATYSRPEPEQEATDTATGQDQGASKQAAAEPENPTESEASA